MKNTVLIRKYADSMPLGTTRFTGKIGELTGRVIFHRMNSEFARKKVYRETIDAFRNKIDDENGVIGIWQGEYWGKWVIGAAKAAEYTGDAELKSFIRSAAFELISLRDENGCISTYRNPEWFNAAPAEEVIRALGVFSDWNWNIWCRKYTLWGLLEAYRLLQEAPILEAAVRLTGNLIDSLEKQNIDLRHTGTFCGLASCSILKPVLQLHQYSGHERFLDFARKIVDSWRAADGSAPNLISNAFSGKPLHEWYPEKKFWTKAYEMMSCVDGLLLYSEMTGDGTVLAASEKLYDLIREHESNGVGSVGFNDQFQHAGIYLNSISEPCDAVHWMRMCFELFKLTGKVKYIDSFEHTFLNAFLAGITRDGRWGMRAVRSSGHHMTAPEQAKMRYNHCCVDNMPRGLMNAVECFLMLAGGKDLVMNSYLPLCCRACLPDGNQVHLTVSGDYPAGGKAFIDLENLRGLNLNLRIPGWSKTLKAAVNGREMTLTGDYGKIPLPGGRNRIELSFDLNVHLEAWPGQGASGQLPDWHRHRYFEGKSDGLRILDGSFARLHCGPLLLARSKLIGSNMSGILSGKSIMHDQCACSLERLDDPDTMALFAAGFTLPDGSVRREKVCDFASAANVDSVDPELFSIFF